MYMYPVRMCKGVQSNQFCGYHCCQHENRQIKNSEFASANCSQGVRNRKKTRVHASTRQACPKGTTKALNRAFCWSRLLVTPTAIIICICMLNSRVRARWLSISIHE